MKDYKYNADCNKYDNNQCLYDQFRGVDPFSGSGRRTDWKDEFMFQVIFWSTILIVIFLVSGCYDLRSMWKDCRITQARNFYQERAYIPDRYVLKGICKVDEFEVR